VTQTHTDTEAQCTRDVVHYVSTGELRGVLRGNLARQGLQQDLQRDLDTIVRDLPLPPARWKRLKEQAQGVLIRVYDIDPDDRQPIWHYGFKTVEAIASFHLFARIYPARASRKFPGDVCRCKECGVFFFSSDHAGASGGRPRTDFCTDEHLEEYQRKTGADRKAASRAGVTVEEWRRRQAAMGAGK
jgi:hypothetical protein